MYDLAIVGLGRAGRARARALASHPRARLKAVVRRSPAPDEWSWAELAARVAELDAAIVCTPNLLHAATVSALLHAGLHVAVEFPVAPDVDAARELFALAAARGRVLHVEHIELLAPGHQALPSIVAELGRPRGGVVRFQGGVDGFVAHPELGGSPALLASARLHRLVDLFGEAEIERARLDASGSGYALTVELAFAGGGVTTLVEERRPTLARGTSLAIACERGTLREPDGGRGGDLFRDDLDHFLDRVAGGSAPLVSESRELHVLSLIAAIERRIGWRSP